MQYGNWISLCTTSLSTTNPSHGRILGVVWSSWNGNCSQHIHVSDFMLWSISWAHAQLTFSSLIFPRWDVIAIILSIFLLTYTYIEAKSNYHRGSILILRYVLQQSWSTFSLSTYLWVRIVRSYVVLVAGFYYAPQRPDNVDDSFFVTQDYSPSSIFESIRLTLASVWRR